MDVAMLLASEVGASESAAAGAAGGVDKPSAPGGPGAASAPDSGAPGFREWLRARMPRQGRAPAGTDDGVRGSGSAAEGAPAAGDQPAAGSAPGAAEAVAAALVALAQPAQGGETAVQPSAALLPGGHAGAGHDVAAPAGIPAGGSPWVTASGGPGTHPAHGPTPWPPVSPAARQMEAAAGQAAGADAGPARDPMAIAGDAAAGGRVGNRPVAMGQGAAAVEPGTASATATAGAMTAEPAGAGGAPDGTARPVRMDSAGGAGDPALPQPPMPAQADRRTAASAAPADARKDRQTGLGGGSGDREAAVPLQGWGSAAVPNAGGPAAALAGDADAGAGQGVLPGGASPLNPLDQESPLADFPVRVLRRDPDGHLAVRVDARELGAIEVAVQDQGGRLDLGLRAARPETADLLGQHLPELLAGLRSRRLDVGSASVAAGFHPPADRQAGHPSDRGGPQGQRPQRRSAVPAVSTVSAAAAVAASTWRTAARLDVMA
ncbi:MAG TPA: flagellar hook-length control protein FliK [Bacillota bacterium]